MANTQNRKLAAILFADIVGYTALMQRDEEYALSIVQRYRSVLTEKVAVRGGEVLNDYGDGSLSIFNSATEAVYCAMEMQVDLNNKTDAFPKVPLRIGIHIGEVIIENGKVLGDGVNLASRIESLGQAGTVFFSRNVFDKIRNRPDILTRPLGSIKLKNVEQPMDIFAVANEGFSVPSREELEGKLERNRPGDISFQDRTLKLPNVLLVVLLFSLLSAFLSWQWYAKYHNTEEIPVQRFHLNFPEDLPIALGSPGLDIGFYSSLAVSPDGSQLAFIALNGTTTQIFIRPFDQLEARPLKDTEGASELLFSPDGNWISFFVPGKLKKLSLNGQLPLEILDVENPMGASWTDKDDIIFSENGALLKISANGGTPEVLFDDQQLSLAYPTLLPGGKQLLAKGNDQNVYSFSLESGAVKKLLIDASAPRYLPTGHLAFIRQGRMMGISFDVEKLEVKGDVFPLIDNLRTETDGRPHFSFSNNGTMLYVPGTTAEMVKFVWVDRHTGKTEDLPLPAKQYGAFDLSPDGQHIAYCLLQSNAPIEVVNILSGQLRKILIPNTEVYRSPVWDPDGKSLAFSAQINGNWKIYRKQISGVEDVEELITFPDDSLRGYVNLYSWSPDNQYLAFTRSRVGENWLLSLKQPGKLINLTTTSAFERHPAFSPDGRFISISTVETGNSEIFVRPFPATGEQWMVSSGLALDPIWSPLGDELFYSSSKGMVSVKIDLEPQFSAQAPVVLFDAGSQDVQGRSFDVSSDAQRFLILQPANSNSQLSAWKSSSNQAVVVTNWFEEVNRLAPKE